MGHMSLDPWHLSLDPWHLSVDPWHLSVDPLHFTLDPWHLSLDPWHLSASFRLSLASFPRSLASFPQSLASFPRSLAPFPRSPWSIYCWSCKFGVADYVELLFKLQAFIYCYCAERVTLVCVHRPPTHPLVGQLWWYNSRYWRRHAMTLLVWWHWGMRWHC